MKDRAQCSNNSLPKTLWLIACGVIIASVIAGLVMTGGPAAQRAKRMDGHRTEDLAEIQRLLVDYYNANKKLPDSLTDLSEDSLKNSRKDPVSGQPYEYRKTGEDTFELCATFETNTTRDRQRPYETPYGDRIDLHTSGYHCFPMKKVQGSGRPDDFIRFQRVNHPR